MPHSKANWYGDVGKILHNAILWLCTPPEDLSITPRSGLTAKGYEGGPFTPDSKSYTLQNNGAEIIHWTAAGTQTWITVDPGSGELAPGENTTVTVSINDNANSLAPGYYSDKVVFLNTDSGFSQTRSVMLEVLAIPGEINVTDSILPEDDLKMPFGEVVYPNSRTEQITITNTDAVHNLIVSNIYLSTYCEDFNDGDAKGWEEIRDEYWEVVAGEYRAKAGQLETLMQSLYCRRKWTDCAVEAKICRTGNIYSAVWVVARASDDFNFPAGTGSAYMVAISGNRSFYVGKLVKGKFRFITEWEFSPYLNKSPAVNTVLLSLNGSEINILFNGNLAWSGTDSSITGPGRIGLMGYSGYDTESVHY
ncbi:MAG: hypothetical protein N2246_11495, partial [Candidatus Sumerlaeia bacterium]|nr:hypothetical protein [Candidatus Sumerlaeia bacterium]